LPAIESESFILTLIASSRGNSAHASRRSRHQYQVVRDWCRQQYWRIAPYWRRTFRWRL